MFSIAAINDRESGGQWEPLAPTKEAQEFHLSQTYNEGLLHLQAKKYDKARELLESVLTDPLISNLQVDNNVTDGHLLQLRFLALKNLASVFLQQGSKYYENALRCYLQAVEIDSKDSVVWNQLGTLSCSMGLLSMSRWAFEQGLFCSPNNWNCMEKLLEVLIAIRDEVACLSVAELILTHWRSHARALYVKSIIQESELTLFAPCGIDKLEPKHVRLNFSNKRPQMNEMDANLDSKRQDRNIELHLSEASWGALVDAILNVGATVDVDGTGALISEENRNARISIHLPSSSQNAVDEKFGMVVGENMKEKEAGASENQTQERRSTRLERLRSRKPGKEGLDFASGKNPSKVMHQLLEPFIVDRLATNDLDSLSSTSTIGSDVAADFLDNEDADVSSFVKGSSKNCGAFHVAHLLLEEVAHRSLPLQESFKLLELDKFARFWGQDRTVECSLFLAELYYDHGSYPANVSKNSQFLSDASYHLCKIIEIVALDFPAYLTNGFHSEITEEMTGTSICLESVVGDQKSLLSNNLPFWVRFFWLSGRLSASSGDKEKACKEFSLSLSLLQNVGDRSGNVIVPLVHCKLVKALTMERIVHEIHLLKVDSLLKKTTCEMIGKGMHLECVRLLAPLLLSTKDIYLDLLSCVHNEDEGVLSVELMALDILISSCKEAKPLDIEVYLHSHFRKLQLLIAAAGMMEIPVSHRIGIMNPTPKANLSLEVEFVENGGRCWNHMVVDEVKAISRGASQIKHFIDQSGGQGGFSAAQHIVGKIQSLLLIVMCSTLGVLCQRSSGSGIGNHSEQVETGCFVDAIIAFCKLQQLNPAIPVKHQVDLIVAMHDLLAEYGLCCAGKDSEGEEGAFLKLAIKHLLALDMKLKSNAHPSSGVLGTKKSDPSEMLSDVKQNEEMIALDEIGGRVLEKLTPEEASPDIIHSSESLGKDEVGLECGEGAAKKLCSSKGEEDCSEDIECGIDNALDQCFFCLYGLNLRSNPDSSIEDDLVTHKNTSRGDYQTREQCADVFHYILSYAKASSKSGLVKLRRVLRAIRRHFPYPPEDILKENLIDKYLDNPNLCEDKLSELMVGDGRLDSVINSMFLDGRDLKTFLASSKVSSEPYLHVYGNLYYLSAQAEEMSAIDKWPGFVLTKEGEDFVEQNANLFKYDLLYNPLRFESWQRLAHIYDEEVDLLLNDGSKHINVVEWRKHPTLPQRVETSRRRARRCSLMSLVLAKIPSQQSLMHELLALVYYDSLQNVVPFYDQRSVLPVKDTAWMALCQNSMKHFERAFHCKPDWSYAFYLGKLCEKLRFSYKKAFSWYSKAASMNPSAVDPVYRIHASRLKLLYNSEKQNLDMLKVVSAHSFNLETKAMALKILGWTNDDLHNSTDGKNGNEEGFEQEGKRPELQQIEEAWDMLYNDCLSALEICTGGELKHFHKARYMLAKGLFKRGRSGDLEKAKDELSFCFKSSRSSFTINMWEIDGMVRKGRRRTTGLSGNKKTLEVSLSESSRKFITCIRKYILLYLSLLEKTGDFCTLDRAYVSLRTDKRFSLCLEDIAPVALGRYIQALVSSIHRADPSFCGGVSSREHLLDRMFNLFMDHGNLCMDISALPEMKSQEFSDSCLYSYIHEYIHSLEKGGRLDMLEAINERIRKRIKNPKLSNVNCAKIYKHASVAWCRAALISLAQITPVSVEGPSSQIHASGGLDYGGTLLYIDLQNNEFWSSCLEDFSHQESPETSWVPILNRLKGVHIRQVSEENMEAATSLLRSTYSLYRESSCGTLPPGVILYTVPYRLSTEGPCSPATEGVEILDLSIQRKLLLWAYTLVFGRYSNIQSVVKHCEETSKSKIKRGTSSSASAQASLSVAGSGNTKDRNAQNDISEVMDNPSSDMVPNQLDVVVVYGSNRESLSTDAHKAFSVALPLLPCNNSSSSEKQAQNTRPDDHGLS